jgi:hypothetical protein
MLTVNGPSTRYCDGISRRSALRIGALGFGAGALTLADLYRAEGSTGGRHKSVINIFLGGGPPHQDMWDIKTDAPPEIRGPFKPIATNVAGIEIGEVFPQIAAIMDKSVVIRSVVGAEDRHDSHQCMTGWNFNDLAPIGRRPSLGAVATKVLGPVDRSVPAFVGLANVGVWKNPGGPGFLGPSFSCFQPDGEGMANMKLNGITSDRLGDRQKLRLSLDQFKAEADATGMMRGVDAFTARAFDVLTSSKLLDALDLTKEDPRVVARYGDGKPYQFQYDGSPTINEHLLMARRLVEAGVRVVTLSYGRWDAHGDNFGMVRDHGGKLDQCLSALIEDLSLRGMLDDVTVIVWGEFGRTPRINANAGRDHWPQVSCAFMAGGGLRGGQAIGTTNRLGEYAKDRPVHFHEIFATLYRNLGIAPESTTLSDPTGRPQYLTTMSPIREIC